MTLIWVQAWMVHAWLERDWGPDGWLVFIAKASDSWTQGA
jgi:hypothetical protein